MSEERAVQQVLPKYVRGADARDGAAVAALFTEAGRVEISYNNSGKLESLGELVGQEAIAAAVSQMMRPHPARGWSHHTTQDHIIEVDGDNATIDAQFLAYEVRAKERPVTGWPGGSRRERKMFGALFGVGTEGIVSSVMGNTTLPAYRGHLNYLTCPISGTE